MDADVSGNQGQGHPLEIAGVAEMPVIHGVPTG
jgi:hypothetical protein